MMIIIQHTITGPKTQSIELQIIIHSSFSQKTPAILCLHTLNLLIYPAWKSSSHSPTLPICFPFPQPPKSAPSIHSLDPPRDPSIDLNLTNNILSTAPLRKYSTAVASDETIHTGAASLPGPHPLAPNPPPRSANPPRAPKISVSDLTVPQTRSREPDLLAQPRTAIMLENK